MAGIVAAHETTAHSGSNAIKLLLENREVWEQLVKQPELIPNAIEESLRLSGGVAAWRRITTKPTVLGGQKLEAGERLLIVSAAANRDPRHFDDPDKIDLYRDNSTDHLTFGFGSHQCLGKNLARLELQVILQELIRRFPSMRLVEQEFEFVPNTSFRGPNNLWVEWDDDLGAPTAKTVYPDIVFNGPSKSSRTRVMEVAEVRKLTENIVSISLRSEDGDLPNWRPGAHIEIEAGGLNRRYSLCGADSDAWEIAVLLEEESRGGSKWIHENVKTGTSVRVRGPRQNFNVDHGADRHILIAGGIGITPILAMADQAKSRGEDYTVHYCGRAREDMAYLDRLERDHGDRTRLHISSEGGRLDLSTLYEEYESGAQVSTCGSNRLTDEVLRVFGDWPMGTVNRESFQSTAAVDPALNDPFEVEIRSTGKIIEVPKETTLLEAVEQEGVELDADCHEGLCGTCVLHLVGADPDVLEHRDHVLSEREKASGDKLMACVSRAKKGSRIVIDR
nr:cytochrome P450 [Brevibacterium ravenspurgense]